MYLGAIDLQAILQKVNSVCPVERTPAYVAWEARYNELLAAADEFSHGFTENRFTAKYEMIRSEIAKQRARMPLTRCMIDAQKGTRQISDFAAILEIRNAHLKEAKAWKDRATNAERNKNIKIALAVATIATAGAAAAAAAGAAGGFATTAGWQAAAGSLVGAAPGATLKQIGGAALKKYAIKYGTEEALKYAGNEFAKHQQKKMTKAQEKELAAQLAAAEREYAALIAQGKTPEAAEAAASKSGGGGIIPLGLIALAFKAFA